jgi:hypothetical protein
VDDISSNKQGAEQMSNKKRLIEALEDEAVEQLSEVKAFRTNRSEKHFDNYQKRAKVALGIIGGYVRLRATVANEETNRLVAMRLERGGLPEAPAPAQLKA